MFLFIVGVCLLKKIIIFYNSKKRPLLDIPHLIVILIKYEVCSDNFNNWQSTNNLFLLVISRLLFWNLFCSVGRSSYCLTFMNHFTDSTLLSSQLAVLLFFGPFVIQFLNQTMISNKITNGWWKCLDSASFPGNEKGSGLWIDFVDSP